ncbi:MAG: FAD-dependent oxidoreductase [Chloroflexota bacterium]
MNGMTRRDFIKLSSILGVSMTLPSILTGCADGEGRAYDGKVLIIGAGAAGMAAGYLLAQRGVDFEILEASTVYGGRFRVNKTFTDFPIPLGAEWLHVEAAMLDEIINDDSIEHDIELIGYSPDKDADGYYEDGEYSTEPAGGEDLKFIGSSWFDFYDEYIVPSIRENIRYNIAIVDIDYSGEQVQLMDSNGNSYSADKVVVTIPMKILQDGDVAFTPALPEGKQDALAEANIWSGFKGFFEFSERFFPSALAFEDSGTDEGQRLFYDASHGQRSDKHILGVFSVGAQAERYQAMSDEQFKANVLGELDEVFDGIASETYIKHMTQNWNDEPYARAAYLEDNAPTWISAAMAESVDDKLYFAGTSYTSFWDWSSVHTAARSAREAVDEITG